MSGQHGYLRPHPSTPKIKTANVATLNVRTLLNNESLEELENEMKKAKIDIIGISEVRREGERMIQTKKGNLFCYIGIDKGQKGVGFIISKEWKEKLISFEGINDRIAVIKMNLGSNNSITIIQVYAPTSIAEKNIVEKFYSQLGEVMNNQKVNKKNRILIMGDFNSQIGQRKEEEEDIMGPYNYGERNESGWRLIRFCQEYQLEIINTLFKKRKGRMWTWISPNLEYKNQIDYMLTPINSKIIKNFDVVKSFGFHSDHRLIKSTIMIEKWRYTIGKRDKLEWNDEEKNKYSQKLSENLIKNHSNENIEEIQNEIEEAIITTIEEIIKERKKESQKTKNKNKIPEETLKLIEKRNKLKRKNTLDKKEKIEIKIINQLIKKKMKEYNENKKNKIIEEILNNTASTKKINKNLSVGINWITYLKNKEGKKVYNRKGINNIATQFYTELYADTTKYPKIENDQIEKIPNIIEEEVSSVIKKLKNGKASGPDKIQNEHIKFAGEEMVKRLTKMYNMIIDEKITPQKWGMSDIIILHKKGEKSKIENYRPLNLGLTIEKIFAKIVARRIKKTLDEQQPKEQAGFRKNFSTIDNLFVINQIIEKSEEYGKNLYMAFIDYTKAFDSVKHNSVISSLIEQGMEKEYIEIIIEIYKKLRARVKTDKVGETFQIKRGVKQGDPLSSLLFNCVLESVFREIDWSKRGININGEYLSNLRFADDIVLLSNNKQELEEMIEELNDEGKKKGLSMNIEKTKIISKEEDEPKIEIDGKKIEVVKELVYLGQKVTIKNKTAEEIERRITIAWKKFWSLKHVLKGPFSIKSKIKIINSCILPTITYGAQTWATTKGDEQKIRVTQNAMERSIMGKKLRDRINMKEIQKKIKNRIDFVHAAKRIKWDWTGHVARQNNERWSYKIKNWYLKEGRVRGRQKTRWDDDIVKFLGGNKKYHRVAYDRTEWYRLREAYAQNKGIMYT